jgi:phosphoribosylformylglycinamidine cyclo-ligase
LAEWGGHKLTDLESTWNLGLGFAVVVRAAASEQVAARLSALGIAAWPLGRLVAQPSDLQGFTTEAKGTVGGAVRLTGNYQN